MEANSSPSSFESPSSPDNNAGRNHEAYDINQQPLFQSPISLKRIQPLPPFSTFPLISKETLVEADETRTILPVRRFTFAYPSTEALGFNPTLQHLKIIRPGPYKPRSYTPTSPQHHTGSFDLTVKIYPNGTSEWLDTIPVGRRVAMIGPLPLPIKRRIYSAGRHVVVIALGIGITLGLAAARFELRRREGASVALVYSVRYREEAIFEDEIDALSEEFGRAFLVRRLTTKEVAEGWRSGRVDEACISECIEGCAMEDTRFLVVGTKPMMKDVWRMLNTMQFDRKRHSLARKRLNK